MSVLIRDMKGDTETHKGFIKVEAEVVIMLQQVKQLQEPSEVRRGKEGFFCGALEGVCPFLYLDFRLLASRNVR